MVRDVDVAKKGGDRSCAKWTVAKAKDSDEGGLVMLEEVLTR